MLEPGPRKLELATTIDGLLAVDPADLYPSLQPLTWPSLPVLPALAIALGSLPAWLAPPVRLPAAPARPTSRSPVEQPA